MEKNEVNSTCEVLVIGGSAGSLEIILGLLPKLALPLKIAIVVVLHRKSSGDSSLAKLFSYKTSIPAHEIEDKDPIVPGMIHIAPADYHLLFEETGTFALDLSEKIQFSRPSIDVAFESAAEAYGSRLAGLLLSGANSDGADGLAMVHEKGGLIAVQNPGTALVSFMPEQALARMTADRILTDTDLPDFVNGL